MNPRITQLQATVIVPTIKCPSAVGWYDVSVGMRNKRQAAAGGIYGFCSAKGKPVYQIYIEAGTSRGALVTLKKMPAGERAVITVTDRDKRLTVAFTIAGRRLVRTSANARPATSFLLGGALVEPTDIVRDAVRIRYATLNGAPVGNAATLIRTSQRRQGKTVLRATALVRGMAFTLRQG
jgi:hypothetical protein